MVIVITNKTIKDIINVIEQVTWQKRKDAPVIDQNKMKDDKKSMNNVVKYLDSLVTNLNPGFDVPFPEHHLRLLIEIKGFSKLEKC